MRAPAFFLLLIGCLGALSPGQPRGDPAARMTWWPEQRAPRAFVTVRASGAAAAPSSVDMPEEMLAASLAGLAARAVNLGESDELVWNDTVVYRYGEWKQRTVARLGLEDRGTFTPWELLARGVRAGLVRGYVAYARDPSGRKAYTSMTAMTGAPTNTSVNTATSLAALHQAALIEESLIPRAEALGLRMLADGRVPISAEDLARLSRSAVAMLDPGVQRNRDVAISQACWVGYGSDAEAARVAARMIERLDDLAPVFGWNEGDEAMNTLAVSARGHPNTASNWVRNQPFLSAGALDASFPPVAGIKASSVDFNDRRPCVALVLSDGDNLQWLCGAFWGQGVGTEALPPKPALYWDHPRHGSFAIGFGACLSQLAQAAPCVLERIAETQPVGTALIEQFAGYWYPDRFAENTGRREQLLREFMRRLNAQNHRTGAVMAGMLMLHSDTPGAAEARRWIAEELHPLLGAFVCDYAPYHAGHGRIDWTADGRGGEVPFVTAGYCLWSDAAAKYPGMGGPDAVADAIARDAAADADAGQFARWVSVHIWSTHTLSDGTKVTGVGAAAALADRLEARGVRVVRPDELLHRIRHERASAASH